MIEKSYGENKMLGGEAGIRTLGRGFSPYNGLANRRLQPLGHLTARAKYKLNGAASDTSKSKEKEVLGSSCGTTSVESARHCG